jgi:hypothetical protein
MTIKEVEEPTTGTADRRGPPDRADRHAEPTG